MSDQPSPLWERYGTRPAPMPNPQQNSFLSLGSESNRPLSSTSSIASDPFARSKQNLQKPEMPSSRSQSREPSIRSGRAVATAKSIDDYEASNFQTVKAAQLLTGIPTKSPKAIELCTGLDLLPSVVTQPPITQARKPKDSSSNASFRRSLAISTVSGRAADVEDTGTYTAPSSPDDDGWKAQKAQRAAGPPSPNLPMKSSLRPRVHSNTPSRSRTGSSASSTITAHTRIPPVPSFSPSATYRQAVSSADLPPIAQGKVKVTEPSTSSGGTRTLACLYLVAGLPKDPTHWTQSEQDVIVAHSEGAVPVYFRPEILGSSVAGEQLIPESQKSKRRNAKNPHRTKLEGFTTAGTPDLSPNEVLKIQAKAMKLSFTKDVEVIASTLAPPSTMHTYSFSVAQDSASEKLSTAGLGQQFDLMISANRPSLGQNDTTYYATTLTVYSHVADKARAQAIRTSVEGGNKAKTHNVARAVKAAASSRKTAKRIERMTGANYTGEKSGAETEMETEAYFSETDYDRPNQGSKSTGIVVPPTPLWLPFSLTLVSRAPLYELMSDVLRISWARHHQDISKHSLTLNNFLNTPALKPGSTIRVPTDLDSDVKFVAEVPGLMNISRESFIKPNLAIWPLFSALGADNLLSLLEIALSPMGRVIIVSQHVMMISLAVETVKTILEVRGWNGISHAAVHARDVKIMTEDPGPWLLGLEASCRSLIVDAAKEIMVVDLDIDRVTCTRPGPDALSTGSVRDTFVKKLEVAIARPKNVSGIPSEYSIAFPQNRFRPFSLIEVDGQATSAERLVPPPNWQFEEQKVFATLDCILSQQPAKGFKAIFKKTSPRKPVHLDPSAVHVQSILRRHSASFVDRRDLMEARLWRLNRRLAFLMSESAEWKQHFEVFNTFSSKLAAESAQLKIKLEKEKKELKRLSGVVSEQNSAQVQLRNRLNETEHAHETAMEELQKVTAIQREIAEQRDLMLQEISSIMPTTDEVLENIDHSNLLTSEPSLSRPGSSSSRHSHSPTSNRRAVSSAHSRASSNRDGNMHTADLSELDEEYGDEKTEQEAVQKMAIQEAMIKIQAALKRAGVASTVSLSPTSTAKHSLVSESPTRSPPKPKSPSRRGSDSSSNVSESMAESMVDPSQRQSNTSPSRKLQTGTGVRTSAVQPGSSPLADTPPTAPPLSPKKMSYFPSNSTLAEEEFLDADEGEDSQQDLPSPLPLPRSTAIPVTNGINGQRPGSSGSVSTFQSSTFAGR